MVDHSLVPEPSSHGHSFDELSSLEPSSRVHSFDEPSSLEPSSDEPFSLQIFAQRQTSDESALSGSLNLDCGVHRSPTWCEGDLHIGVTAVVVGVLRKLRWGSIIVVVTGIGAIVATGGRRRTCVGGLSVIFM